MIPTCSGCGGPLVRPGFGPAVEFVGPPTCQLCSEGSLDAGEQLLVTAALYHVRRGEDRCPSVQPLWACYLAQLLGAEGLAALIVDSEKGILPALVAAGDRLEQLVHRLLAEATSYITVVTENERASRNDAYAQRNQLAVVLARAAMANGWLAGRAVDEEGEEGWRDVVIVDLPTGQVSWHLPEGDPTITALPLYPGRWDGHSQALKQVRLNSFAAEGA